MVPRIEPSDTTAAVVTCGGLSPGLNNVIRSVFLELHHAYGVQEVLGWVERHDTDLIVLTSHKVAVDKEGEGWGTLSYQLGILAPCSVLLVK